MSIEGKHAYRFGYLKSEQWQNIRSEVLLRHNAMCLICRRKDVSNDIHHAQYPSNFWKTEARHCVVLCRECHDEVHKRMQKKASWKEFRSLIAKMREEKKVPGYLIKGLRVNKLSVNGNTVAIVSEEASYQLLNEKPKCFWCHGIYNVRLRDIIERYGVDNKKFNNSRLWKFCDSCWEKLNKEFTWPDNPTKVFPKLRMFCFPKPIEKNNTLTDYDI